MLLLNAVCIICTFVLNLINYKYYSDMTEDEFDMLGGWLILITVVWPVGLIIFVHDAFIHYKKLWTKE